ncbi:3-oxoacyl-[acyl-carrier protein] reductase [Fontibacillus panacisegetis]|uniref:3-oxoacyl-[acyl-carrier protein] reductase n=1 Tax=Fontibacillus panacisegetis TaxID=670482 RepID=A0A1G7P1B1_9BACL|nr:SDR family oxidoreductase [Fontibacillus panacisegetis]SDF80085.1 3-oxoacyl-[acyl-carrier protein] reductase [Fontibacillus panacisegetis]
MLKNMKIIVTGAASGIGMEVALHCLREGAKVVACDMNDGSLNSLKQTVGSDNLYTYKLDVSDYNEVVSLFTYIEQEHPDVNGLVNNAGIYLGKNLLDYKVDEIDKVLDINVKGYVYLSQLFGEFIIRRNNLGVIVNMSSVSGIEGSSDAIYGLTKAGILGLTKSCAMNFSPHIRVNAVAPTIVETSMMDNIPKWRIEEYTNHQLIKQPLLPEDVAHTVIFLLSEKSKHYTGATFDINNGCYLR